VMGVSFGSRRNSPDGEQKTYLPVGRQGTNALASSPIDFVSAAGSVRVPQNLISWIDFTRIDFWG
jgi:hypothetical protein